MTTIEIKGQLLNIIARLEDENLLKEILEYSIGVARDTDTLEDLSPEALAGLELAIEESYEDENGTPHEEVMQMAEEWLKK
jgi:hypothetical protein